MTDKQHTFNCLRRCPFSKLEDTWLEILQKQISVHEASIEFIEYYLKNGWTKEEYEKELHLRYYSDEDKFPEVEENA